MGPGATAAPVCGGDDVDDPLYRRTSVCPNCHHRLEARRCKAVCVRCGYFDSCADLL
jgi:hypothetical protein